MSIRLFLPFFKFPAKNEDQIFPETTGTNLEGPPQSYDAPLWMVPGRAGDMEGSGRASGDAGLAAEMEAQGDFIIQPVAVSMCGISEATWGRAQDSPPSPPFAPSNDPCVDFESDTMPLIVPTVVDRLGEREETWGQAQKLD